MCIHTQEQFYTLLLFKQQNEQKINYIYVSASTCVGDFIRFESVYVVTANLDLEMLV